MQNTTQLIDLKLLLEAQLYFMVIEKAQQLHFIFGSDSQSSDIRTCEHFCRSIIGGIGSVVEIRVCIYTPYELLSIGLSLVGIDVPRQHRQKRETNVDDYAANFGVVQLVHA